MIRTATNLVLVLLATTAAADVLRAGRQLDVNVPAQLFGAEGPRIAGGADGELAVAWAVIEPDSSDFDFVARFYDAASQPAGLPAPTHAVDLPFQIRGDVAALPGGKFVVGWHSSGGTITNVFARIFDADGTPLGSEFQVNTTPAHSLSQLAIAARPDGRFVVVRAGGCGVCGRVFDDTGAPLTGEFTIGSGFPFDVAVTGAGDFVAALAADGLVAQRFDVTGTLLGPPIEVADLEHIDLFTVPSIAGDSDGGFIVAWHDLEGPGVFSYDVFARRFAADDSPSGSRYLVNVTTQGHQSSPTAAIDASGETLIAWRNNSKGGASDIVGRRYDASGAALGGEFQVNERVKGNEGGPDVSAVGSRGFVVTWQVPPSNGQYASVHAQRLTPDAPVAGEKLLYIDDPVLSKRRLTWTAGDAAVTTTPGLSMTPTLDGAYLHLFNASGSGESVCIPLPAASWTATGKASAPTYKYSDASFTHGPCSSVEVKAGKLKATCKGTVQPIGYTLDEAAQGSIGVSLRSGDAQYCTRFGGTVGQDSGLIRMFSAKKAPPPAGCPTPPATCP